MRSDISIIITNYNYGQYLARSVRSALSQILTIPKVIVIDDASTDDSVKVLEQFGDSILIIKNKKNLGVAAAANIGLKIADTQFVLRLDADDYITKNCCYLLKEFLEANNHLLGVSCDYILTDDNENILERCSASNSPISCGILYRKDLLVQFGGYNDKMRHKEEEELRSRLGSRYKIANLEIPLYRYRRHSANKTLTAEYKAWSVT